MPKSNKKEKKVCKVCKKEFNGSGIKYCSYECAYKVINSKKKIKITQEISRQKVICLVYASYMLGFLAHSESKRNIDNPKNFEEINNIVSLLSSNK